MADRLERARVLPVEGLRALQGAKQQIQDATVGKLRKQLILDTVRAAIECAREGKALSEVLSPNVAALVRKTLTGLDPELAWKPDTVLKMADSLAQLRSTPGGR